MIISIQRCTEIWEQQVTQLLFISPVLKMILVQKCSKMLGRDGYDNYGNDYGNEEQEEFDVNDRTDNFDVNERTGNFDANDRADDDFEGNGEGDDFDVNDRAEATLVAVTVLLKISPSKKLQNQRQKQQRLKLNLQNVLLRAVVNMILMLI